MSTPCARLLWAGHKRLLTSQQTGFHRHSYSQILYVLGGAVSVRLSPETLVLGEHEFILINPDVEHQFTRNEPSETFDAKFLLQDAETLASFASPTGYHRGRSADVGHLLERIILEGEHRSHLYLAMASAHLEELVIHLARRFSDPAPASPPLAKKSSYDGLRSSFPSQEDTSQLVVNLIHYLEKHVDEDVTLGRLGEEFGYSPTYLCDRFSAIVGAPPMKYLLGIRVQRAKELLVQDELPIKDIARSVGYATPQAFSRVFSRETGESPTSFRSKHTARRQLEVLFVDRSRAIGLGIDPQWSI